MVYHIAAPGASQPILPKHPGVRAGPVDKGFGFIQGERGDLFFHHSALDGASIKNSARAGESEFEEGRGPKGPRARENVKPV